MGARFAGAWPARLDSAPPSMITLAVVHVTRSRGPVEPAGERPVPHALSLDRKRRRRRRDRGSSPRQDAKSGNRKPVIGRRGKRPPWRHESRPPPRGEERRARGRRARFPAGGRPVGRGADAVRRGDDARAAGARLGTRRIAAELGCSGNTVKRWLALKGDASPTAIPAAPPGARRARNVARGALPPPRRQRRCRAPGARRRARGHGAGRSTTTTGGTAAGGACSTAPA